MGKLMTAVVVLALLTLLVGCSREQSEEGDHVWREQVETLDRARSVEQTIGEAQERQRREIDERTR
ncbi:MAG: hypothetical protein GWO02_06415 [Gammaproteobacteria bacterium]|nr:hypothetical protein [Gammaproteobacteria bacterium]